MKKNIVITDLTRMTRGNVCIAGYDESNQGVRPILEHSNISEKLIVINGKPLIFPFATVEFDFIKSVPKKPHTEDVIFNPVSIKLIDSIIDREKILKISFFPNVEAIFEQPIKTGPGYYVNDGEGVRSMGSTQPKEIVEVKYESDENGVSGFRLIFIDFKGIKYKLKITDLTWNYFCNYLLRKNVDPIENAKIVTRDIQTKKVYLRIGLARNWDKFPGRCYLQVNGIYTFPDYFEGKKFTDFYKEY